MQRKLREFVPESGFMNFYSTIPFQKGLACRFNVEATHKTFTDFVEKAGDAGCHVRVLEDAEKERDAQAPCLH